MTHKIFWFGVHSGFSFQKNQPIVTIILTII